MRLPRGGDHSTMASLIISLGVDAGPDFLRDPRRGCAPGKVHPDVFFSENLDLAKKICQRCMFKNQCDAYATARHEKHGVWGGKKRGRRLTPKQIENILEGEAE